MTLFKRYIALLLIFIAIVLLWNTMVIYPLKIFVVFMHEVSHGLAAIATGGSIVEIEINPHQGGYVLTLGGYRFLILIAGYLGNLLCGGLILLLTARTHADKMISIFIGACIVVITVVFVDGGLPSFFGFHFFKGGNFIIYGDFPPFTYFFSIGFGVALVTISFFFSKTINYWILLCIGTINCLYPIIDITRSRSDALLLSEITGIPTEIWSGIWIVFAIGITFLFLYLAVNRSVMLANSSDSTDAESA